MKEFFDKLADREKNDATAKPTLKGRKRKRADAVDNRAVALEFEFARAKIARVRLVDNSVQLKPDAVKARTDLNNCKSRFDEVKQALKLASITMDGVWKQSARSAKAPEEAIL